MTRRRILHLLNIMGRLAGGGFTFLLRDDFMTAASAPLTSPRTAEPGPGTLTLVQTDGEFSISGGELVFPAQTTAAWGDLALYGTQLTRACGKAVLSKGAIASGIVAMCGWDIDALTTTNAGILLLAPTTLTVNAHGAVNLVVGAFAVDTEYSFVCVQRGTGYWYFIKGGAFADWTLLYVGAAGSSNEYPTLNSYSAVGTLDTFRVLDLPAPFDSDYGLCSERIASPTANATITSEANADIEYAWSAVTSETVELSVRRTDDDNRWIMRGDQAGSTVKLIERNAGVETERASAAQTWTNGTSYRMFIVQDGNTIRGYVANVLKWTYSSASFNNTATGVKVNKAGTDLVAWPRVLSGSAASLLDQAVA